MIPYAIPSAIFIGLALSSIWLVFFLLEDKEDPEPKLIITKTFIIGMISALAAAAIEKVFGELCVNLQFSDYSLFSLSGNAFIEEFIKFLVVFIFISASKYFDQPIDRMIYMISAALGFATVENFFFLSNALSVTELAGLSVLRFVGATLMHALASGVLGYAWARRRIIIGIILATVIHVIFNFLVLTKGPELWPTGFLLLISFILFYEFDRIKKYYYERKKR